ncbi:radical SAM/SPASM domain-containing protein [Candidatus Auribacterota bacterium]
MKWHAAKAFLQVIFLNKKIPLLIGWSLTNRCNLRCRYCDSWEYPERELQTRELFRIIDQVCALGCRRISYTGGEPLLREDIGEIVRYSKRKGIYTGINSNGLLVKEKIDKIKDVDLLMLSLDGEQKTHDYLRGDGSYKKTIEAMELGKKRNIKIMVTSVLTKDNLESIDFILEKAQFFKFYVYFQPVTNLPLGMQNIQKLLPLQNEFRQTIYKLLAYKKRGNDFIANSRVSLMHLLNWPSHKNMICNAGRIYCAIDPSGYLYACSNLRNNVQGENILTKGFKKAFFSLEKIFCDNCWCASTLEMNCLFSFNINTVLNVLKVS